ncbi:MAG: hypothetical protein AAGC45_13860 [Bacteroidota bacterium]
MKKIVAAALLVVCFACSDGDLTIENIDFEDGTVAFCTLQFDQMDTQRTLFFKIVEDEALILDLQSGLFDNETSLDTITSNLGSQSTLTYRLFSENVSDDYFCDDIPPINPMVLEETTASSGIVNIVTSVDTVNSITKTYVHNISFTDLTIIGGDNERITDEPGLDFGTYLTSLNSSVNNEFSNYSSTAVSSCTDEITSTITLFKLLNDEALLLILPSSLLINQATTEPRTIPLGTIPDDMTATFSNPVFKKTVSEALICSDFSGDSDLENSFTTISGTLSVTTTESGDSTAENPLFNHVLTLSDFVVEDANENEIPVIETFTFGTVTTTTSN